MRTDFERDNTNPFRKAGTSETDLQHYERLRDVFSKVEGMRDPQAEKPNGYIRFDKEGALLYRKNEEDEWGEYQALHRCG